MINSRIKKTTVEWIVLVVLILVLMVPSWRFTIASIIQRGILKTGLLKAQPSFYESYLKVEDFNVSLQDATGQMHSLSEWEGKVLFINIWASWCAPCVAEMGDIEKLYKQLGENSNLQFVMISIDKDWNKARSFVQKRGYSFPIFRLITPLPEVLQSNSIPSTYVISSQGRLVLKKQGMASYSHMEFIEFMTSLVHEATGS